MANGFKEKFKGFLKKVLSQRAGNKSKAKLWPKYLSGPVKKTDV